MKKLVTDETLRQVMPHLAKAKRDLYLAHLNYAMGEFGITTRLRVAAFIAQLAHESAELRYMEEIASGSAYEGRKDLGNTQKGDGKRYKGRGPIQLTGRANYRTTGKALGLPLEDEPEIAKLPEHAFRIAGYFWKSHGLNELADESRFKEITKRINGGYNGLADRVKCYDRALRVLPESGDVQDEDDADGHDPRDEEKGVTTSTQPETETEGTPPPAPAAEVKASQPSLFTKIGSLSLPAGVMTILAAIGKFVQSLPPWAWVVIIGMGIVAGYLIYHESQKRAHDRTLRVMDAAASKTENNLRLI